jgi:hypothetical protein
MVHSAVKLVATSTQVAWYCQQAGGFAAYVAVFGVILNMDIYLDSFNLACMCIGALFWVHADSEDLLEVLADVWFPLFACLHSQLQMGLWLAGFSFVRAGGLIIH